MPTFADMARRLAVETMPIRLAGTIRARRSGNSRTVPSGMFVSLGPRHDAPGTLRFG